MSELPKIFGLSDVKGIGRFESPFPNATFTPIDDVLAVPLVFHDLLQVTSKFKDSLSYGILFKNGTSLQWTRTSASVLCKKLLAVKEQSKLPLKARIVKVKRYYDLTD